MAFSRCSAEFSYCGSLQFEHNGTFGSEIEISRKTKYTFKTKVLGKLSVLSDRRRLSRDSTIVP